MTPPAEADPIGSLRNALQASRPGADLGLLQRAYEVAAECHLGQRRKSGDPYITHPVNVATIMAGLGANDQMLCAAMLHDTVEDTPFTMSALRREFGIEVAALVAGVTALDRLRARQIADVLAAIDSADNRVVVLKMADRLHNMRTVEFLPPLKQLTKARESIDVFAPVAEELRMPAIGAELQTLSFATLIRNQPARRPSYRTIVALDIERSTSRSDPVKAELRVMLYELFEAALRAAGIDRQRRDEFSDLGDGLLALIHPAGPDPAGLLVSRVLPQLGRLLPGYHAGPADPGHVRPPGPAAGRPPAPGPGR